MSEASDLVAVGEALAAARRVSGLGALGSCIVAAIVVEFLRVLKERHRGGKNPLAGRFWIEAALGLVIGLLEKWQDQHCTGALAVALPDPDAILAPST